MSQQSKRSQFDIRRSVEVVFANLAYCYKNLKPKSELRDFIPDILNIVALRDDPIIDGTLEILTQFFSPEDQQKAQEVIARTPIGPVILSCTYNLRALKAINADSRELAWSYLSEAKYWCGVAVSNKDINEILKTNLLNNTPYAAGGNGRADVYARYRMYAYELVRLKKPSLGWKSRADAASKIKESVDRKFDQENPNYKKKGISERKIHEWIMDMPEADQLFRK